jgi:hypothetical protein
VQIGKKEPGRLLDGREWNEFPQPDAKTLQALDAAVREWNQSILRQKMARHRVRKWIVSS